MNLAEMAEMARAGRKRSTHARRRLTTRADREVVVVPTPELVAQRERASGRADVSDGYPLDILRSRGAITSAQAAAGHCLAILRYRLYGRPAGSVDALYRRIVAGLADGLEGGGGRLDDEVAYRELRSAYDAALAVLRRAGPTALHVVVAVAVYLARPRWLDAVVDGLTPGPLAEAERAALVAGLEALAVALPSS